MVERSSIFDMIGPVMIGPSSSHTAGVVRIGRMARKILGAEPQKITVTFYNSFATTYEGHGSDRAVVAGMMDFQTDDERIRNAIDIAKSKGIEIHFKAMNSAPKFHPNTLRIESEIGNRKIEVLGVSRGGGLITIAEIDGFHANLAGQTTTLVITADDAVGAIAYVAQTISDDPCNIATLIVTRRAKNNDAKHIYELDSELKPETIDLLRNAPWVKELVYIPGSDM